LLVLVLVYALVANGASANTLNSYLFANLAFFLSQAVLVFRLVRKNYGSFWIGVVRRDEPPARKLSVPEAVRVWLQLCWPQVAFVVAVYLFISWVGSSVEPDKLQQLSSPVLLVRILVVGPIAIRLAMYAAYPNFRLQAYRRKPWTESRS